MECKFSSLYCSSVILPELIDTLWNVNCFESIYASSPVKELIDTLWNVNNTTDVTNNSPCGINRYIMECKYFKTLNVVIL